jgi:D-sedoheptulose 7-phosphate isomerase
MPEFFPSYFAELAARLHDAQPAELEALCECFRQVSARGRKIVMAGNGASSAIASHIAVDLTKAVGIRAVTFHDTDLITCFGNDYGYEHWIAKAIGFYGDPGDVAVLVSSSGRSPNILNGAAQAKAQGLQLVTLSGFDANNPLRTCGDLNLWVDSRQYNIVEATHQSWLLAVVDRIAQGGAS